MDKNVSSDISRAVQLANDKTLGQLQINRYAQLKYVELKVYVSYQEDQIKTKYTEFPLSKVKVNKDEILNLVHNCFGTDNK